MGDFGVNPVLSGLMQAFSMANVMKHQRMQQEQLQLQKNKDKRQEEHEQFSEGRQTLGDRMSALAGGAKPLDENGQYSQASSIPAPLPGIPDTQVQMNGIPADPNRVAKIGGSSYQLATQDEQNDTAFARKTREVEAFSNIHSRGQIEAIKAKADADRAERVTDVPGIGPTDRYAVPFLTEQLREKNNNASKAADRADKINDRTSRETIADKNNASRERAAGIRAERGLTANAQEVKNRFEQRQMDSAKADNVKDNIAEQTQWGVVKDQTAMLAEDSTANALQKAQARGKIETANKKILDLQKRQKQRTESFGGTYSNGAPQQSNPYKTAAPTANPYR